MIYGSKLLLTDIVTEDANDCPEVVGNVMDGSYINPIQFAIECVTFEHNMFESLIEADFCEAYNNAGLQTLSEAQVHALNEEAKNGIIKKFLEVIEKFVASVKHFFAEVLPEFIQKVFMSSKALLDKYGDITAKSFDDDVTVKVINNTELENINKLIEDYVSWFTSNDVLKAQDSASVLQEKLDAINEKIDAIVVDSQGADDNVKKAYERLASGWKKEQQDFAKKQNEIILASKKVADSFKKEADVDTEVAHANYQSANGVIKSLNELLGIYKKLITTVAKVDRAGYIHLGRVASAAENKAATKQTSEESANEAAQAQFDTYSLLVEIANDEFFEDCVAEVF